MRKSGSFLLPIVAFLLVLFLLALFLLQHASLARTSSLTTPTLSPSLSYINFGTNQYKQTTPYPFAFTTGQSGGCLTNANFVYCIGGDIASPPYVTNAVYYANISNSGLGSWQSTSPYPVSQEATSCVSYSNSIYCVGGDGNSPRLDYNFVYYADVLSSGALGTWQPTASYPANIDSASCVINLNTIYCVGGVNIQASGPEYNSVYSAQIQNGGGLGNWTAQDQYPMPTTNGSDTLDCMNYNQTIYCVGGLNEIANPPYAFNNVYYSKIGSNGSLSAWQKTANYPTNIGTYSCAILSNTIYCPGGATHYYTYCTNKSQCILYAMQTAYQSYTAPILAGGGIGAWTPTTSYPTNALPNCIAYGNNAYCVGGFGKNSYPSNEISDAYYISYNPITFTSSWSGGTPAYTASLYSSSDLECNTSSTLVQTLSGLPTGSATFSPVFPTSNTTYCVNIIDSASATADSIDSQVIALT